MPKLALLDPTKTGRQAEDLENQTAPSRRWTRRSDSRDRQDLSDSPGGAVPGRPPDRKLSVPGADGLGQDSHRRGNRRGPAEQSRSRDQDRLRRVSTQP